MPHHLPCGKILLCALALSVRAPSLHNSQPWRWRVAPDGLHLYADRSKWLAEADPEGRDLLMSCGAALHHLRVAFAALGWASRVRHLPDPENPDHLAIVELVEHTPSRDDIALVAAIPRRRTDRRRYGSWPVPEGLLDQLAEDTALLGVGLRPITDPLARFRLVNAIADADDFQWTNPDYVRELMAWTSRQGEAEGIPSTSVPRVTAFDSDDVRDRFPAGSLDQPPGAEDDADAGVLVVLATATDDQTAQLRAGEATSAALLRATSMGLASCPLSQPLEVPETREAVRTGVLDGNVHPQMVVRLGWAHLNADPLPATPRRPLAEIVDGLT